MEPERAGFGDRHAGSAPRLIINFSQEVPHQLLQLG